MVKKKKSIEATSYGARYGRTPRRKQAKIEMERRQRYLCSNCGFKMVTRESIGIWKCKKCDHTFTGGAYFYRTKIAEIAQRNISRSKS